jgi:glycosyltransferase involved in cell wall biosynthesis
MRILCFIDWLGSGGAQRQMVTMAKGFQQRGHEVRFLTYHPGGHFLPELKAAQIPCTFLPKSGALRRILAVRRVLRRGWQDVVLSFLEVPSLCAELAGLPLRKWGLVVGERLAHPKMGEGWRRWRRWPHRFADAIVANSHSNRVMLEVAWPRLRPKLTTIYNAVELDRFHPRQLPGPSTKSSSEFRLVVASSYQRKKNMMGLVQALHILRKPGSMNLVVDWYGAAPDPEPLREAMDFVESHGLTSNIRFHPPIQEVEVEYQSADAVGLFSKYEGLPNAVCEGMACGKPIIMSDVCDAKHLVEDGKNGFLCNPDSPTSIANALERIGVLPIAERLEMGMESRRRAAQLFSPDKILESYEKVLHSAAYGFCSREMIQAR